jgi:esterase
MKLFYRKFGEGEPLIILHGLFGQSDNWASLARQFAGRGLAVYTLDLRNHGLSPWSDEWNYPVMARDVEEFTEELGLRNITLLGHSMGGMTAMQYAFLFPDKLSKLIVVDMAPRAYPPHHDGVMEGLLSVDLNRVKTRKEAEEQLSHTINENATRQFLLKNLYWKDDTRLAWRFNLSVIEKNIGMTGIPFDPEGRRSSIPAWFIRGDHSDYVLDSDVERIEELFPLAKLITIPGAGHWIHADKPALFLDTVMDICK